MRHVFTTLYHEGLAYRAERMVNWCPSCATVLSDLEVNHVESSGHLYSIAYPLVGTAASSSSPRRGRRRCSATRRSPSTRTTERYAGFAGRRATLPLTGREIPVIADAFVDPKFGTGVVKVTPAHDPNDFEAGKRNALESVTVIGFDGKMTAAAGAAYAGLDRFEARKKVLRDLDAAGLRRGEKSHVIPLARCQRCDTIVEPLVSLQWFVKIGAARREGRRRDGRGRDALRARALEEDVRRVDAEHPRLVRLAPALVGARDSGLVLPGRPRHGPEAGRGRPGRRARRAAREASRATRTSSTRGSRRGSCRSRSSAGRRRRADFARYYPTSVLVTGFDILFFWVARMIMAGSLFDGRAPFADVVLHGLVRDEKGQKMSKTKGNVVDPLEMCDEFGADAVRFTLAVLSGTGRDLPFGKTRVAGYRAFATKVWNAARFALQMLEGGAAVPPDALDFASLGTVDRWILARLSEATGKVNASLEAFRFDEAANALYQFFWSDFCDGYVEMVKPVLRGADVPEAEKEKTRGVLTRVLLDSLALLHPFMPFVSCEIREALNGDGLRLTMAKFPERERRVDGPARGRDGRTAAGDRDANPESPRRARPRPDRGRSRLGLELPEDPFRRKCSVTSRSSAISRA